MAGYLAGDETNGAGVRGSDENVVQTDLAKQRQCTRQAGTLLHQQWRPEHERAQVEVAPHTRLAHISAHSNAQAASCCHSPSHTKHGVAVQEPYFLNGWPTWPS